MSRNDCPEGTRAWRRFRLRLGHHCVLHPGLYALLVESSAPHIVAVAVAVVVVAVVVAVAGSNVNGVGIMPDQRLHDGNVNVGRSVPNTAIGTIVGIDFVTTDLVVLHVG